MSNLNIGCGKDIHRGVEKWINLDCKEMPGVDVVHDINNPLPFMDNQIDNILAQHILEHLAPDKKIYILRELWRITKPGGNIEIMLPNYNHRNAFMDPTHLSIWHQGTADYFVPGHWANYYSDFRWKIITNEVRGDEDCEIHWVLRTIK